MTHFVLKILHRDRHALSRGDRLSEMMRIRMGSEGYVVIVWTGGEKQRRVKGVIKGFLQGCSYILCLEG